MDYSYFPYPSRRTVTFGRAGMVATSQQLAAQAGLDMLKLGGNAIDAAIATAACLTVVEPTANGIGSDAFAIVWLKEGGIYGLNASGPAPAAMTIENLRAKGNTQMPRHGWGAVTVPGTPAAWGALMERFGKLTLKQVLAPAIRYATEGFPVPAFVQERWKRSADILYAPYRENPEFVPWYNTYTHNGNAPEVGEIYRLPGHARTLGMLAEHGTEVFYKGEIAQAIDKAAVVAGGALFASDLAGYKPRWVEPISINYKGIDVWELPPNGQGAAALHALNIVKGLTVSNREDPITWHRQIESMKLAALDVKRYVTDPDHMDVRIEDMLSEKYAAIRRTLVGERAKVQSSGELPKGGTVYLCTADGEGNMVSYIQSCYEGFGSGVVIDGYGISMQNRGYSFTFDERHPNCLKPGKRPYHTIIPAFLSKDGKAIGPMGVMGGAMQPQGHMQVVMNMVDFGLNPQAALDAPRWMWVKDNEVVTEPATPEPIVRALQRMGHNITYSTEVAMFGKGQIIMRRDDGVLIGATEPRADGAVVTF